jgi:hypothetical protein
LDDFFSLEEKSVQIILKSLEAYKYGWISQNKKKMVLEMRRILSLFYETRDIKFAEITEYELLKLIDRGAKTLEERKKQIQSIKDAEEAVEKAAFFGFASTIPLKRSSYADIDYSDILIGVDLHESEGELFSFHEEQSDSEESEGFSYIDPVIPAKVIITGEREEIEYLDEDTELSEEELSEEEEDPEEAARELRHSMGIYTSSEDSNEESESENDFSETDYPDPG